VKWFDAREGRRGAWGPFAAVALAVVLLLGCTSEDSQAWPFPPDPELEAEVDGLLATMTVEEKVGQTVQADISSVTADDVRTYHLGAVLAGGGSEPGGRHDAPPEEWLLLVDRYYLASIDPSGGRTAVPIMFGIDSVHGNSNVVGATLFPHNIGLGAANNPGLVEEIGRITALETRVTGMDWVFAPVVAVPRDDRWGRTYEGYSESPDIVAALAPAIVEGLQGRVGADSFLSQERVVATPKHFIGDGGTTGGVDQGDTELDDQELLAVHGAGYPPAIGAGAQTVMASFNSVNGQKVHGSERLLSDELRDRMTFGGFVLGDWNGHGQVAGCSPTDCPAAFNAGVDMIMAPDSWRGYIETTIDHVRSGVIPVERLDEAVRRILRVKLRLGLLDGPPPSERSVGGRFELLGAAEHRQVARQAVRESLVLLKNDGAVLPVDPGSHILVTGTGSDDMGRQSGGWTLSWQGTGTERADFPNAQTILEAIDEQASAAGGTVEHSADGSYRERPDVAVVVFSEEPYAEFTGDRTSLALTDGESPELVAARALQGDGVPVVAVLLSGRPLWVNRELNASDAFVAAWLPGSEGGGVADLLLAGDNGDPRHDFTGRLSFSWPQRADQFMLNDGAEVYDPLFPLGYGLSTGDDGSLEPLPETTGRSTATSPTTG
jgi:beta-glucosidase